MWKMSIGVFSAAMLIVVPLALVGCGSKEEALRQVEAGKREVAASNFVAAIACFDKAIRADSGNGEAYLLRAQAINELITRDYRDRQYERKDALRDLDQAAKLMPKSGEVYLEKGYTLTGMTRLDEAMRSHSKAIELLADPAPALIARAALHFHNGKGQEAFDDATAAIERQPLRAEYYETRAMYARFVGKFRLSRIDQAKADKLKAAGGQVSLEELRALEGEPAATQKLATQQESAAIKEEQQRLVGKWQVLVNEASTGRLETATRDYHFTFRGDTYSIVLDGKQQQSAKYVLNPSENPRQIDFIGVLEGDEVTFMGIYEFTDGGRLRICLARPGESRPDGFVVTGRPERSLYTLERR